MAIIILFHMLTNLWVGVREKESKSASWFLSKRYLRIDLGHFQLLKVEMQFKNIDNSLTLNIVAAVL